MPTQDGDFALVIGINDYPKYGVDGNNLQGAVDDAHRVAAWLTDQDNGGGLPPDNCKLIVSTASPPSPSKQQVDDILDALWEATDQAETRRRFYLYFSGHGHADNIDDVSLCLANWSHRRRHAALSSGMYRRLIRHCMRFDQVMVLLDCCRLREYAASGLASELDCILPDENAGSTRSFVVYATEFQQAAFEGRDGDDRPPRGHLTKALLEGLRGGAPLQPGGGVSAHDLADYLRIRVPEIADADGRTQQVVVESSLPSDPPPVFGSQRPRHAPDPTAPNCRLRFSAARRGPIRLESPSLEALWTGNADSGPVELYLQRGHNLLLELETGEEHPFTIRRPEEIIDVQF